MAKFEYKIGNETNPRDQFLFIIRFFLAYLYRWLIYHYLAKLWFDIISGWDYDANYLTYYDKWKMKGRHSDPQPISCHRCTWAGPRKKAIHGYHWNGIDDMEPVDECPVCGSEV